MAEDAHVPAEIHDVALSAKRQRLQLDAAQAGIPMDLLAQQTLQSSAGKCDWEENELIDGRKCCGSGPRRLLTFRIGCFFTLSLCLPNLAVLGFH